MLNNLFKNDAPLPSSEAENAAIYKLPDPPPSEMREVERSFARLFSTQDGRKVLAYLQAITFQKALGPASPDAQLRYIEGQRALVATILRLVDRGRKG